MRMIGAPATRAEFDERAARLEQLSALLIRTVCILGTPDSIILYINSLTGARTRLAFIVPVFIDRGEIDLA